MSRNHRSSWREERLNDYVNRDHASSMIRQGYRWANARPEGRQPGQQAAMTMDNMLEDIDRYLDGTRAERAVVIAKLIKDKQVREFWEKNVKDNPRMR